MRQPGRCFIRREFGPLGLIVIVGLAAFLKEPRFLHSESLSSILLWIPMLCIVGCGQMLVIVTRGIDVSIGSITGFAAMAMGLLFKNDPHANLMVGASVSIGAGLLLGSINGALISLAKIPPIIVTLGGLSAYRGLIFMISKGSQVDSNDLPNSLTDLSQKGPLTVGGLTIPWIVLWGLLIAILVAYLARYTRFGRNVFAIGGNPRAAELRGVPTKRVVLLVYALTGALAGCSGIVYASRFGFVNPGSAGKGMELSVIAAVVIGGTRVTGGSGSVSGVVLGCVLLGMINVSLAVLGISEDYQALVYGLIILLSLLLDTGFHRWLAADRGEAT